MLERICWAVLALVHLTPAFALVRPALITRLYGVGRGSALFLLMQHRAALFGVVLIACIWATLDPSVRRPAAVATALSMLSFLALWSLAGAPATLRSIALADAVALPALAYVAWRAFGAA
jgi:hypothetical protein